MPDDPKKTTQDFLEGLTRVMWAMLKEIRTANKLRKDQPPQLTKLVHDWPCEQCGAYYQSFDDLVHHQFGSHREVFENDLYEVAECPCYFCEGTRAQEASDRARAARHDAGKAAPSSA